MVRALLMRVYPTPADLPESLSFKGKTIFKTSEPSEDVKDPAVVNGELWFYITDGGDKFAKVITTRPPAYLRAAIKKGKKKCNGGESY